jgi:hypothetical protein
MTRHANEPDWPKDSPNGTVLKAPAEFVQKIREYIAQLDQVRLKELRR